MTEKQLKKLKDGTRVWHNPARVNSVLTLLELLPRYGTVGHIRRGLLRQTFIAWDGSSTTTPSDSAFVKYLEVVP